MKFKGFDDWIEIFKGGKQTDSAGVEHNGDEVITKALETFDLLQHEPPVVVGHPVDNAPAFGWVAGLKQTGDILFAKFKDIIPEFKEAVENGLYKKRSASFYPDGRLRHVGFLGAAPPAVKGLQNIGFSVEKEFATFEFGETSHWVWRSLSDVLRNIREYFIEKEGKEKADLLIPNWELEAIEGESRNVNTVGEDGYSEGQNKKKEIKTMAYTEDELQAKMTAQKTEFMEKLTEQEEQAKQEKEVVREEIKTEFAEKQREIDLALTKKDIISFCDTQSKEGKIVPAWLKSGLSEFMISLDSESKFEFVEGKEKGSQLKWFISFLEGLPKLVDFEEIATKEKDAGSGDAGKKLEALTVKKMNENKDLTYGAAFIDVQLENPELANEYAQTI